MGRARLCRTNPPGYLLFNIDQFATVNSKFALQITIALQSESVCVGGEEVLSTSLSCMLVQGLSIHGLPTTNRESVSDSRDMQLPS